jgi:hypothetical protein
MAQAYRGSELTAQWAFIKLGLVRRKLVGVVASDSRARTGSI